MEFQTQFQGVLGAGETRWWSSWGWQINEMVLWGVVPIAGLPSDNLSLDRVEIQHNAGQAFNVYIVYVTNHGSSPIVFDGVYVRIPGTLL